MHQHVTTLPQHTIAKPVRCSGIGLHSGRKVHLTCRPADEDTGVVFHVRTDDGLRPLGLAPDKVVGTGLATTLGGAEASVATVEHLLAAVRGLGIDNIALEVEGGEVPIMDGSAASFVFLLRSAGIRAQSLPRRVLAVRRPLVMEQDGKRIEARPHDGFKVDYDIDFAHPLIGRQSMSVDVTPETFIRHLAKARTFGFLKEVEQLHKNGLALGGSLDNAVVLDEYGVVNPEGLRFEDEFVRHKVLDFVGDMALAPLPLTGHFVVSCSGHAMNNAFLRALTGAGDYVAERELPLPEAAAEAVPQTRPQGMPVPA